MKSQVLSSRDLLSPPGDTIQETIDHLHMSQRELADRMGRDPKTVMKLFKARK